MFHSRVNIVVAIAAVMAGCGIPPEPVVNQGVHPEQWAEIESTLGQATLRHRATVNQLKTERRDTEEWDRQFMSARYNLVVSLCNYASFLMQHRGKTEEPKQLLREMERLSDDFLWDYEGRLVAFDLGTYRGRAYVLLAEVAATEVEKEEHLMKALGWSAFQLSTDTLSGKLKEDPTIRNPSNPMYAAVKEIIARGYLHKMKALIGYGDLKKDGQYYRMAVDEGNKAFSSYPDCLQEDLFLQIRLEQEKAGVKLEP